VFLRCGKICVVFALEVRDAAGEQRQPCLDSTFHPSPPARGRGGIRNGQWLRKRSFFSDESFEKCPEY